MLTKTKLTRVYITDKDKQGNPLMGKFGPYKKIAIKTEAHSDKWLSGFISKSTDVTNSWREGDIVNITITENGQWLNFRPATKIDVLEDKVKKLEDAVTMLLQGKNEKVAPAEEVNSELSEIDADSLPF